jgi:methylmalonyl-CoA mutase N-terminal domain/subunit
VGREGVSISTLADFERLFADIPLDQVTTSMTINCTASVALAMYLALADKQGVAWANVGGTMQNDMLKEFIAQKEWICGPGPAVRIVTDMIEFTSRHVPKFHPVSISGYHIREAGSTAVQELAFTLADGLAYVEAALARGLPIDDFAPRLSFFFDIHNDFFEEIAKLRAARRLWARFMKERYGATRAESMQLRTHTQTAGVSATAQQPLNNIARVAIQALAAVLGGAQSLHTNSYDETWALPTEEAVTVALRTQQIIAEETGVALTSDPLGGSYHLERMTDRMEAGALDYINRIDAMGGMVRAIDTGFPQKEIADAAYRYQLMDDRNDKVVVGVNKYAMAEEKPIHYLRLDESIELEQIEKVARVKAGRDAARVEQRLKQLAETCRSGGNVMPVLIDAVKDYVSLGEISDVYRQVFGLYREPAAAHTPPADSTPTVPRNVNARPVKVTKAPAESTVEPAKPAEPAQPKVEPPSVEKVDPAIVSIESEEPLSLRNSPRGPVIGQVQKGERVERQFEMYEAGEKWVFVKVASQNLAGFLESDSIETRKNPAR